MVLALSGCEQLLPAGPDGGQRHVPGTYHDAQRSSGHRAHLALEGEKQLACRDCHFVSDAGFSAAAVKPCSECHVKQQEHHHPFDGGVAMTCFSCHTFKDARAEKWGCAGCHVDGREGVPHVTVHTEKCESCHRPHGTPFTKAADCGQCHDLSVSHGRGEKALEADTCMTCHPHHTPAKQALQQCTGCHFGPKVPAKARVSPGALFANGHAGCSSCHSDHRFTAAEAKGCSSCHEKKPVLAADKHVACLTCHRPHDPRAAPKTCESCHTDAHVKHPRDALGRPCLGCHPVHEPPARPALAVPCITCHRDEPFAGVVHAEGVECQKCHLEGHAAKPKREALCASCHAKQQTLVATNRGHQQCDACHAGLPHGEPVAPKGCLSCHEKKKPPQAGHTECQSCHQSHSAKVLTQCTSCHDTKEKPLTGLHRVAKHQQCRTCHAPHTPEPGVGPKTCRSCHVELPAKSHPTAPQSCVTCHLFSAPR